VAAKLPAADGADDPIPAADDPIPAADDDVPAAHDDTHAAHDDTHAAHDDRTLTADDRTLTADDRTLTADDRTLTADDRAKHKGNDPGAAADAHTNAADHASDAFTAAGDTAGATQRQGSSRVLSPVVVEPPAGYGSAAHAGAVAATTRAADSKPKLRRFSGVI